MGRNSGVKIKIADPVEFFEDMQEQKGDPKNTYVGELYFTAHRGTYTVQAAVKKGNRKSEEALRELEFWAVPAALAGGAYPAAEAEALWKDVLLNQFHDILPGSHITPVYRDAMADYEEIEQRVERLIGTGEQYFNSLNFPRTHLTFVPDEMGNSTRYGKKGNWVIPNLPALSCGEITVEEVSNEWLSIGEKVVTPFYEIEFNTDGSIESLYDRELNREWVNGEFNKLKLYKDNPGVYDAWDILPNYKDREAEIKILSPLKTIEKNSEVVSFACTLGTEKSTWKRIIRVFRQSRGIEVENIVDWNEKHVLAKAQFNCNVLTRKAVCDTSAGFVERETHRNTTWQQARFEVCHHKWVDMAETDGGIALINDSKYGVGLLENSMSLSLLRATIRPDVTSDLGHHEFAYMIYPHGDDFVKAEINNIAFEYNVPLGKADLTCENSFGELYMQTMKMSEKGHMIVVRLSEQNGRRGKIKLGGKVKLLNFLEDVVDETDTIEYKPFEIITIGIQA